MRRSRRGGTITPAFTGAGEDSFVAVVVTKLTGALLFILMLSMVIMALIPKAVDGPQTTGLADPDDVPPPLTITTPETLPEAIAGRPYAVALAAMGGRGPLQWTIAGSLPEGLDFDPQTGQLAGTPREGTAEPVRLVVRVSDGVAHASKVTRFLVYQPERPLTVPSPWEPSLPPIPWRSWLEQGFGFLVLLLVHLVGLSALSSLDHWARGRDQAATAADATMRRTRRRFALYRSLLWLTTTAAVVVLAVWLWYPRA